MRTIEQIDCFFKVSISKMGGLESFENRVVSSANMNRLSPGTTPGISLMYTKNRTVTRIDPCGACDCCSLEGIVLILNLDWCWISVNCSYLREKRRAIPELAHWLAALQVMWIHVYVHNQVIETFQLFYMLRKVFLRLFITAINVLQLFWLCKAILTISLIDLFLRQ